MAPMAPPFPPPLCEAKEEVPCDGLSTNAREYFTRTNLVKMKNVITDGPNTLALYYSS